MLYFQGNVFTGIIGLNSMNSTQYPSTIWQEHVLGRLASLNIKMAEKERKYSRQQYLWTVCQSVVPWQCTTRFWPAVRLCQLEMVPRCFPIPSPQQDSEGEKSRPLDRMRKIPFDGTSVPLYWLNWDSAMYICDDVVILSSMWYVFRFDHAHGLKRYLSIYLPLICLHQKWWFLQIGQR